MNAVIIFLLLAGLMLTGMPVSISLGLTVLSFLFLFTEVPIESVALNVHRHREVRDHGDPFFIWPALTHGGVARRMIRLPRWSATGRAGWGWGQWWPPRCSRRSRVQPATVVAVGPIHSGHGQGRLPAALWCGRGGSAGAWAS
jgi:C4-dicarboxylate transporter DctM subunit